jgi:hypothetical protein
MAASSVHWSPRRCLAPVLVQRPTGGSSYAGPLDGNVEALAEALSHRQI